MISTLAVAVVAGFVASAAPVQPTFSTDYRTALTVASEQHKPVAVFITAGGSQQLVSGQAIRPETLSALKASFVCVSVDTATEAGKKLAASFEMSEGLVISDAAGKSQALRHAGKVTESQLSTYSQTYAAADAVTLSALTLTPTCANGRCGTAAPTCTSGSCGVPVASCTNGSCGVPVATCTSGHCGTAPTCGAKSSCSTGHCGSPVPSCTSGGCGSTHVSSCSSNSCGGRRGFFRRGCR